jgi:hypothetical protein
VVRKYSVGRLNSLKMRDSQAYPPTPQAPSHHGGSPEVFKLLNSDRSRVLTRRFHNQFWPLAGLSTACGPQKPLRVAICMTPGADSGFFPRFFDELCSASLRCANLVSHVVTSQRLAA